MQELYAMAAQVGASEAPVLIQGETGSGKEVLARHIHAHSKRANRSFLKLNCAALPSELVESELFGYERGAFTGAFQRKPGMFEIADGGTLLLDEIGDMDFKLQAKLLQVLQDHEFQRLGGRETLRVDVRVIAATHKDLDKAMAANQFRQDLYYRLNVVALHVPPLRERKEDILGLAEVLMQKYASGDGPVPEIAPALRQALLLHDWPGNVRELEHVLERAAILAGEEAVLTARDIDFGVEMN
jgi:transcriptional regulator with PAS, ATPase and Fis domain